MSGDWYLHTFTQKQILFISFISLRTIVMRVSHRDNEEDGQAAVDLEKKALCVQNNQN